MADLSITAANVQLQSKTSTETKVQVGEAITAGQPLYRKSSDSKYYKANAVTGSSEAEAIGIALTGASADGYVMMVQSGGMIIGATLTAAEVYIVSDTAGNIRPIGDLGSSEFLTILGYASSTTVLEVDINATGVAK